MLSLWNQVPTTINMDGLSGQNCPKKRIYGASRYICTHMHVHIVHMCMCIQT